MKILTIIPAIEKYSKIPKIYSRFLLKTPLILYSINLAKNLGKNKDLFVLTDDINVSNICEINNVNAIFITDIINELPYDIFENINIIFNYIKNKTNSDYGYILVLNPNFPLIKRETIINNLNYFLDSDKSVAISVKESKYDQKELWYKNRETSEFNALNYLIENNITQIYEKLDTFYLIKSESISELDNLTKNEKQIFTIGFPENIEVRNHIDWWIAEKFLKRRKILIRVDGYKEIGFGHIYRMITLANSLIDHEILFVSNEEYKSGVKLLAHSNYPIKTFHFADEFKNIIRSFSPDIIINDILDTNQKYIQKLKNNNIFVVNFEDLGKGSENADLVINALYERKNFLDNHYWGKDYYILREEFHIIGQKPIKKDVNKILITFGGTDPNNYTLRILNVLHNLDLKNLDIEVILGLGYQNRDSLTEFVQAENLKVLIKQNIENISKYMYEADLIFTSAGRTVYEIASIGTPTIILCQNERETLHTFANEENGIINLGLGYNLSDKQIEETVLNVINNYNLRIELNKKMLRNNLESGTSNVISLIFSQYEKFKAEDKIEKL